MGINIEVAHRATDHKIEFDISKHSEEVRIIFYDKNNKIEAILSIPTREQAHLVSARTDSISLREGPAQ